MKSIADEYLETKDSVSSQPACFSLCAQLLGSWSQSDPSVLDFLRNIAKKTRMQSQFCAWEET